MKYILDKSSDQISCQLCGQISPLYHLLGNQFSKQLFDQLFIQIANQLFDQLLLQLSRHLVILSLESPASAGRRQRRTQQGNRQETWTLVFISSNCRQRDQQPEQGPAAKHTPAILLAR